MSRKVARDIAFKLIFEYTFNQDKKDDMIEEYAIDMQLDADDKAYITEVYLGVVAHYDELIEDIKNSVQNFSLERIFKVDLALMLLALYEIKFMDSIPYKVSVNEALNLAKNYSSEKSMNYINGVLSKFAR